MNLKQKLDYHYKAFDKSQISPDPLQFLHLFKDERDIEAIGFIASVFAYGNVTQINNTLNKIICMMENRPYEYLINSGNLPLHIRSLDLKHRFYTEADVKLFLSLLNKILKKYGRLKNLFLNFYNSSEPNLKKAISNFSNHLLGQIQKDSPDKISRGIKFMFPDSESGSACKRINLFLRWMVRKDELDFGLWNEIPPDKLVIPVDTHIARVCQLLKLTKRKNVSWKMAEEITENLKKFDPADPVKYDFAICHIGMRKLKF
ncbi:MAG TPA: TIGR02757 family protein [Ignavibacteriaceae bacterium]|nr:TIGR02757 family protein [Ignavibacteriaceae bacterium]